MTDRDLLQQALEALEAIAWSNNTTWQSQRAQIEADALRERLAQPEHDAALAERERCAALLEENAMACKNPIYRSLLQANAKEIRGQL